MAKDEEIRLELLLGPEHKEQIARAAGGKIAVACRRLVGVEGLPGMELHLAKKWTYTGQESRQYVVLPLAMAERACKAMLESWKYNSTSTGGIDEFGFVAGWYRKIPTMSTHAKSPPVLDYSGGAQTAAFPPYLDNTLYAAIKAPEGKVHQLFYTLDNPELALHAGAHYLAVSPAQQIASTGSYAMRGVHPDRVQKPKKQK